LYRILATAQAGALRLYIIVSLQKASHPILYPFAYTNRVTNVDS